MFITYYIHSIQNVCNFYTTVLRFCSLVGDISHVKSLKLELPLELDLFKNYQT